MITAFGRLVQQSSSPFTISIILILAWMAASDGEVTSNEFECLRQVARQEQLELQLDEIVAFARKGSIADLQLAIEILQKLDVGSKQLYLRMAIDMALNDRVLTANEGHIIRLIADAFGFDSSELDEMFRDIAGSAFPQPSDPSSPAWWSHKAAGSQKQESDNTKAARESKATSSMQRLRDLAVLGLEESATHQEIKAAYRRMVAVHHPDKFAALGQDAVFAANQTFTRIQAAYERLVES
jgi:DnaJ-domain-containing protein 1